MQMRILSLLLLLACARGRLDTIGAVSMKGTTASLLADYKCSTVIIWINDQGKLKG
jgi:hypothetical protein